LVEKRYLNIKIIRRPKMRKVSKIIWSLSMILFVALFSSVYAGPPAKFQIRPVEPEKMKKRIPPPALASIKNVHIIECSVGGSTGRLVITWSYGPGARPEKVRIDVQKEGEGSILVPRGTVVEASGDVTRAEVIIWGLSFSLDEPYTIVFTAFYPPWGKRVYSFEKKCAE